MKVAYADPPYLKQAQKLYSDADFDRIERWEQLIHDLCQHWPDGWAMSLSSTSLRQILPLCPEDVRIAAWVKPFASFKPGVNPGYAWEPVIWRGGRKRRARTEWTVPDFVSARIAFEKGLPGAKPEEFCWWLFGLLGLRAGDDLVDIFPGTGIVGRTFEAFQRQHLLKMPVGAVARQDRLVTG